MSPCPQLQLVCTDFDGTIHSDFETPAIPGQFAQLIGELQAAGVRWVINTGRELNDLLHTLNRANLAVSPDYLVVVEREIHVRAGAGFTPHTAWNERCTQTHADLFAQLRHEVEDLFNWVRRHFTAHVYADPWSPFCLVAANPHDAGAIVRHLNDWCRRWPELTVVSNHVYARLSHAAYHKGSALREVARLCDARPESSFVAGDHSNDLPMLRREFGRWLVAPANAIPEVRQAVTEAGGWVIEAHAGHAVVAGLQRCLAAIAGRR